MLPACHHHPKLLLLWLSATHRAAGAEHDSEQDQFSSQDGFQHESEDLFADGALPGGSAEDAVQLDDSAPGSAFKPVNSTSRTGVDDVMKGLRLFGATSLQERLQQQVRHLNRVFLHCVSISWR